MPNYILTVTCTDKLGIVAAISSFLAENKGFILESQQYGDLTTGNFFMRTYFTMPEDNHSLSHQALEEKFETVAKKFSMTWALYSSTYRMNVVVMVSKYGHCLNAILNRRSMGDLPIDISAIISNHTDLERMAASYDVPFYHFPINASANAQQEQEVLKLLSALPVDLIILARYMQVLSPGFVEHYQGRIINIHHSFLPSFKGSDPYQQAFDRGVKLIGATAHYVTAQLDEGPIIEQEVMRVNHAASTEQLISIGHDIEVVALTRAIKWHTEYRVFQNGKKTVVFN